ncbi:TPA: glycosyltransferase [Candidatus Woesearchaeota archaeon]|nr:Glycosyl transferase family 2 [archaeon GW2011_AR15]MBS3104531.1 glycosyltransferase [Candidatus Woesearchaeota archaeon]HIH41155.1 glycosyltransferase [Candidatus Woesearchaeota archaeon]
MNTTFSITFYLPALNSEKTIGKCIESILKQEISPKNILVVDNNSADNTVKIAKKFKVRVLNLGRQNLAAARNLALRNCMTELIAAVDSDCVLEKGWLKEIMKDFDKKGVAGVGGKLIEKNKKALADKWRSFHLKQNWGNQKITNPNFLFGANTVFRISALRKIGGYDEKYTTNYEDVDVSRRLKKSGFDIVYEPDAACYHLKEDTFSSVIRAARKWTFHGYPLPDSFAGVMMRLLVYNPYITLVFLFKELMSLKLGLSIVTLPGFFYNEFYDIGFYLKSLQKA